MGSKTYLKALGTLLWKDALLERRGMETVVMTVGFSLLIVVMFHFVFDIRDGEAARFFPGALWTSLFFAGTVGMSRSGAAHDVQGQQAGLLLAPVDRSVLFLSKHVFHLGLMLLVELIAVPLFIASFGLRHIHAPLLLVAALFLGTWGLTALGTLFTGMDGANRGSGLLMPLVLFPLLVPVALGSASIVAAAVSGDVTDTTMAWLRLLVFFNVVFTVIPALFYEYIVEV